jgi:hypothetical protein
MKKTRIAVLLAFATISAKAELGAHDTTFMLQILSGEVMAFVMETTDNLLLDSTERVFRNRLKDWEELSNGRSTPKQRSFIKGIAKDLYYTEVRPFVREQYQALSQDELYLVVMAIGSDDEDNKGSVLLREIVEKTTKKLMSVINEKVPEFSQACNMANSTPFLDTEQKNPAKNYQKLNKGDAYIVSSPVPVWIAYGSNKHASFHEIPTGGAFKIATLRATASSTWYGVFVIDLFGDKLGNGWINSEDLQGQQLIPYSK